MDMQAEILKLIENEEKNTQNIAVLSKDIERINDKIMSAFPTGDIDGHRRYHEMMIEDMAERKRMRQAIKEKTVAGLLWAAIVWLGVAAWDHLQSLISTRVR